MLTPLQIKQAEQTVSKIDYLLALNTATQRAEQARREESWATAALQYARCAELCKDLKKLGIENALATQDDVMRQMQNQITQLG